MVARVPPSGASKARALLEAALSAEVIDLDAHRPVWRNVRGVCRACGVGAIATEHANCPLDKTECGTCGAMAFSVTHFVVGEQLVPRLELVGGD
jgi:ribosomal protein S27AE